MRTTYIIAKRSRHSVVDGGRQGQSVVNLADKATRARRSWPKRHMTPTDCQEDPALCGDMSDPYADGNGSKILPMFDPYADGKRQILPDVRSKQGAEMAGR